MPRKARSAALFDRQMRPSSRKRVKAGQGLSMQSIALALSAWRDSLGRSSRSPRSRSTMSGALNSCRTARRRSVLWPLIARSISNSASMRRTASGASGEITLAGHGRVVAVHPLGSEDVRLHSAQQRRQHGNACAHLVGQGRQAERNPLACVALDLAVQRLMPPVLLEQDHRPQARAGPATGV